MADKEKEATRKEYSDAILKMVNVLFDPLNVETVRELGLTDESNLLGLTLINSSREAFHWAMSITREAGKRKLARNDDEENARHWSLSKIKRVAFLIARRSLNMRAFSMGVGLAGKQSYDTDEGEDIDRGWDAR